ncbi:MAG: GyrI-like domain-containing protein [Anaerolineae bacterium]|nr:GyrI-like domain-containing protein [Anaerolineae bacterium]
MTKRDLKKELKHLYNPTHKQASEVVVPPMWYVMIDGAGDPDHSPTFEAAMATLYGLTYTLKFASKKELGIDYGVMTLEGLWWVDGHNGAVDLSPEADRSGWRWTAMIMQPNHITPPLFDAAVEALRKKKNPPNLEAVRFECYDEGLSAQIMHIGPYSAEQPTIERLHGYILEQGYQLRGKHHEIYLSDPRKTAPEKMKTVLRQPMAK